MGVLKLSFSASRFATKLGRMLSRTQGKLVGVQQAMRVMGGSFLLFDSFSSIASALVLAFALALVLQDVVERSRSYLVTGVVCAMLLANVGAVVGQEQGWLREWETWELDNGEFEGELVWRNLVWLVLPVEGVILWALGAMSHSRLLWLAGWIMIGVALFWDVRTLLFMNPEGCSRCHTEAGKIESFCHSLENIGSELADLTCGPAAVLEGFLPDLNHVKCPSFSSEEMCKHTCFISKALVLGQFVLKIAAKGTILTALAPKMFPLFQATGLTVVSLAVTGLAADLSEAMSRTMRDGSVDDPTNLLLLLFWAGAMVVAAERGLPKEASRDSLLPIPFILLPFLAVSLGTFDKLPDWGTALWE